MKGVKEIIFPCKRERERWNLRKGEEHGLGSHKGSVRRKPSPEALVFQSPLAKISSLSASSKPLLVLTPQGANLLPLLLCFPSAFTLEDPAHLEQFPSLMLAPLLAHFTNFHLKIRCLLSFAFFYFLLELFPVAAAP